MSTPGAYQNPDITPCGGGFRWSPQTPPNIGGANPLRGFATMVIDRGRFRNYIVPITGAPDVTVISAKDHIGDPSAPIYNATRPLCTFNSSLYGTPIVLGNNTNYVASKEDILVSYGFPQYDYNNPLSCVQITYDMSFYSAESPISNEEIPDSAGCDIYITTMANSQVKIGTLPITRFRESPDEKNSSSLTGVGDGALFLNLKFKTAEDQLNRSSYPKVKNVFIKNNYPDSSLTIIIKKIMFFTADRVNLRFSGGSAQLPCGAIGYSLLISGQFVPTTSYVSTIDTSAGQLNFSGGTDSSGAFTWPPNDRIVGCNTHMKIFNPDYTSGSPGFAHSLNLHLLIISFPFTPFPLATNLGVIIGPRPFYQQFVFQGTSKVVDNDSITINTLQPTTKQQFGIYTVNSDTSGEQIAGPFTVLPLATIVKSSGSPMYEFQSDLIDYTKQTFKNLYFNSEGVQYFDDTGGSVMSESYFGTPARGVSCLGAYDNIFGKFQSRTMTYAPKIFYNDPALDEVFLQTPLLTFRLVSSFDYTGTNILQPGFMTTVINALKIDPSGAFDIKLVYRIFALKKDQNFETYDPNDSSISGFAKLHHLKFIPSSGDKPSTIKTASYDKSWTFENVLVSGNIYSDLQSIYADLMVNDSSYNFKISGQPFDLYVGVYSVVTLNENAKNINFENLTSFDLPQISIVLDSDFIVYLPIYYPKSFSNGGYLQAQKDFGWKGKYTKDTNMYYLTNTTFTGEEHDSEQPYNAVFSGSESLGTLLTLNFKQPSGNTKVLSKVTGGTNLEPVLTEIDFIFINDNLSNAVILDGEWNIDFAIDTGDAKKSKIKLEVDLVDTVSGKFLLKIFNTPYEALGGSSGAFSYKIKIPFTLPPTISNLLLRVFIENYSTEFDFIISNIVVKNNTIKFFSYDNSVLIAGPPLGFYEDLPLTPTGNVGACSDFALYLDLPSSGYVVFDPKVGISINGAIYSPTWISELPKDMEVNYKTNIASGTSFKIVSGVKPYDIFFRTGLKSQIYSVDSKKNGLTNTIQTVTNTVSGFNVKQYSTESFRRCTNSNQIVLTPNTSGTFDNLEIEYPALTKSETMNMVGQSSKYASTNTIHYVADVPNYFVTQSSPSGYFYPNDNPEDVVPFLSVAEYVSADYKSNTIYLIGVTPHGNLIYSLSSVYSSTKNTSLSLVEGVADDTELSGLNISQAYTLSGTANSYFPGIKVCGSSVLVFYTFATSEKNIKNTAIYVRNLSGSDFPPYKLFDFSDLGIDSQNINNISVCKDDTHPDRTDFSLAFDCSGKVFVINLIYTNFLITYGNLILVYGDIEKNSSNDSVFVNQLNELIASSKLRVLNFNDPENNQFIYRKNLPESQRVGFVDYDGVYVGIQFIDSNTIYEILCDKYFSLDATFRKIGSI